MIECVVFSDRAALALLSEIRDQPTNETGGVFLGLRCGGIWYVIENCDPGIHAIFQPSYFEYDHAYINHVINKLSRLYRYPLALLGLWHRHPGSMDTFSSTDDATNAEYAKLHPEGAISGIVNIDPHLRLSLYAVQWPLAYRHVDHAIGDRYIPTSLLSYQSRRDVMQELSVMETVPVSLNPNIDENTRSRMFSLLHAWQPWSEQLSPLDSSAGIYAIDALDSEQILEAMAEDLDFVAQLGIDMRLRFNEVAQLELREVDQTGCDTGFYLAFMRRGKEPVYLWQGKCYLYQSGMLRYAVEAFLRRKGGF